MGRRKRTAVPQYDAGPKRSGGAYDRNLINGEDKATTPQAEDHASQQAGVSRAASARTHRLEGDDPHMELALELAREGDDFLLLPYQPTPSINPPRPRTLAAGYDENTYTLRVRFRDGTPWEYYGVPPRIWTTFQREKSPGRYINRVLNSYPYARGDF